ncbi:unnamed protein product [Camellia sinensis]
MDFRAKEKELQAKEAELICFALLLFFVKRFGHCLVFQMQVQIESWPQKKHPLRVVDDSNKGSARYFDYLFYIDFEASMAEPRAQYALGHLQVRNKLKKINYWEARMFTCTSVAVAKQQR